MNASSHAETAPASQAPLVSVIVPTFNEAQDVSRALAAILDQDHPRNRSEVIVADSGSTDGTVAIVERHLADQGLARVVTTSNPASNTPRNLNAALAEARGEIICRVDARSIIPSHYISTCVALLAQDPHVVVVGGAQVAKPRDRTARSAGIARALNNRWSMGGSRYRRGSASGPADTVYLGAFRRADLEAAGGWDERFGTNQDFELNQRLGRTGTIWFSHDIPVGYLPRQDHRALFAQYERFGRAKVRYWTLLGQRPQPRQIGLLAAPILAMLGVGGLRRSGVPWALLGLGGAAAAVVLEVAGADEPQGSVATHAEGTVAMAAVTAGWTLGVWRESFSHLAMRATHG